MFYVNNNNLHSFCSAIAVKCPALTPEIFRQGLTLPNYQLAVWRRVVLPPPAHRRRTFSLFIKWLRHLLLLTAFSPLCYDKLADK